MILSTILVVALAFLGVVSLILGLWALHLSSKEVTQLDSIKLMILSLIGITLGLNGIILAFIV